MLALERNPEQEGSAARPFLVKATLLLGSYNPADPTGAGVPVEEKTPCEFLASPSGRTAVQTPGVLKARLCHLWQKNALCQKGSSWMALIQSEYLTMGHQVTLWPELLIRSWMLSNPQVTG